MTPYNECYARRDPGQSNRKCRAKAKWLITITDDRNTNQLHSLLCDHHAETALTHHYATDEHVRIEKQPI